MSIKKSAILFGIALSMAAFINGCSSDTKEGGFTNVARVDEAKCAQCHGSSREKLTGRVIYDDYAQSLHLVKGVGCQDCHGGGAMHNGVGPMPVPRPGREQCERCHDSIVHTYEGSKHLSGPLENEEGAPCQRCHTHQGAVLATILGFTGDKSVMAAMVNAPGLIIKPEPITCITCHVTHKTNELRVDPNWAPSTVVGSATSDGNAQYKLCTQCHTYINPNGALVASGNNGTASFYHNTAWYRTIASTHYDNPNTGVGLASTKIEGYVLRTKNADPCFDCHGHESKTNSGNLESVVLSDGKRYYKIVSPESTIYTDWAKSSHAGGLLDQKYAAQATAPTVTGPDGNTYVKRDAALTDTVMAAGVDGTSGAAWEHYNWDDTSTRGSCQRCHTATGVSNYLNNPATYNATGNNFSHLSGWSATGGSPQNELLYCWGCHSNAGTGELRNPGAMTLNYTYKGAAVTLADLGKTNLCVACHGGMGNNDNGATRSSRLAGHHGVAALSLFSMQTNFGYRYADKNYDNLPYFAHDKIGSTDGSGPCVSCHMKSSNSHSLSVLSNDETVILTQAVCDSCHTGSYAMTATKIEEESAGYQNAGLYLTDLLKNTVTNYMNLAITSSNVTNTTTVPDVGAYGAYQNSLLTSDEKGMFAHNRSLAKRLIFDSIDWMDNGVLDGTITIPAVYAEARTWLTATSGVATRP